MLYVTIMREMHWMDPRVASRKREKSTNSQHAKHDRSTTVPCNDKSFLLDKTSHWPSLPLDCFVLLLNHYNNNNKYYYYYYYTKKW